MANDPAKTRVLTCYYRPKPGGFCRRLFQAIEALLVDGHTVHYLSVVPFPIEHPRCIHHRFPWPRSKTEGFWFWTCFHLFAPCILFYLTLRHRITRLFAFGHNYGFLLQPARLICRQPVAVFLRADAMATHRLKNHPTWLIHTDGLIESLALYRARVYCVSNTLAQRVRDARRYLRPLTIEVLPNSLPTLRIPRNDSKPSALPLRLTSAGILEERKNPVLLIRMMALVKPEHARLNIYGTGPQEVQLTNIIESLGLKDRVDLKGWCDDPNEFLRNTDLLLFPSRHEGSPNTVLEALAAGVPVLASDIPEHREILPSQSLLPIDDVRIWAGAVRQIALNPGRRLRELRDLQETAAERLCFDWEKTIVRAILETPSGPIVKEGHHAKTD